MARPTKLNPEMQKRLTDALSGGNYNDTACAYAGISEPTFYAWMKKGQEEYDRLENPRSSAPTKPDTLPFLEFFKAVKRAQIDAEVRNVALINKAAKGGDEVKTKTTTTSTPVKVNGRALRDDDGNIVYAEKTVTESVKAPPQWQPAAWFLERKSPDKFGRQRLELTGKDGEPIQAVGMSQKEYLEMVEKRRTKLAQNTRGLLEDEL